MSRCMVLNASYEYLSIVEHWMDALVLVLAGKATPIESYPEVVRSQHCTFNLPAVVVMRKQVKITRRRRLFDSPTRKAVFTRDGFTCQYCGARLSMAKGTRDHVLPLSRGGADALCNVVACCMPCNSRKDDRTPEEAGMVLQGRPRSLTEEEKLRCLLKTCRTREREMWLSCLERNGIRLWAS
jgi:5-methylcytosine-specific restriction endonuclease McrA